MLQVDIRDLNKGPVETAGKIERDDPLFEGLGLELDAAVQVEGRLSRAGEDSFLWQAELRGKARGTCRRCLTEVALPFELDLDVVFSADPEMADDPSVYPLKPPVMQVDLAPAVREEVALAVTAFPLCREECAGLCPRCGADLNAGPCACKAPAEPG
ncbi:MAG TPA: DUF177 domain-containing protein [Gemmatimonadales bacterium]|nr:DUF177 domain-containing protein [Gemmatimonadales bacterium]